MNNTITEHNVETGQIITRELTEQEVAQNLINGEKAKIERDERKAKEAAKVALLAKLGITEDEAKLLLS